MRGYIDAAGEYYESVSGPAEQGDILVPLRPSETYEIDLDRRVWVQRRKGMTHTTPRPADTAVPASLADVAVIVHDLSEAVQCHNRAWADLRSVVAEHSHQIAAHLDEVKPLLAALRDMQSLARTARVASRGLVILWRMMVYGGGALALVWALAHGDMAAIKRALSILTWQP